MFFQEAFIDDSLLIMHFIKSQSSRELILAFGSWKSLKKSITWTCDFLQHQRTSHIDFRTPIWQKGDLLVVVDKRIRISEGRKRNSAVVLPWSTQQKVAQLYVRNSTPNFIYLRVNRKGNTTPVHNFKIIGIT